MVRVLMPVFYNEIHEVGSIMGGFSLGFHKSMLGVMVRVLMPGFYNEIHEVGSIMGGF